MKFFKSKKLWIPVVVIIFLLAFLTAYGAYRDSVVQYYREKRDERLLKESERITAEIETAYRNDVDGGGTPEETIELFIAALEKKDIAQASKYYELSVQPKALASLEEELKENGDLRLSINYFAEVTSKGTKQCNEKGDGCTFEYKYVETEDQTSLIVGTNDKILIPKGSMSRELIDLELNTRTNIWKIKQPI